MHKSGYTIYQKFPPSPPCTCEICLYFCNRPGWWTVAEAKDAMEHGYAKRMMLELAPDYSFGVLSPAFKGNEAYFALQEYAKNTCTFLVDNRCTIFQRTFQPIECRFCHHDRIGLGSLCHAQVGKDWNSHKGMRLVREWLYISNLKLPSEIAW